MQDPASHGGFGAFASAGRPVGKLRVSAATVPVECLIRIYQKIVSPHLPPCCRFTPTCSSYALEAYRIHGFWRGSLLTLWRLLRCHPFCHGGWDPVPPAKNKTSNCGLS